MNRYAMVVMAAAAWATPASADVLELHGVVTSVSQGSDVPLDQPVTIRVRMDRMVPIETLPLDREVVNYDFDEPSDDFSVEVSFDGSRSLAPIMLPGTAYHIMHLQGQWASVNFEGHKGADVHEFQLFFQGNHENDALLIPTLELSDYEQAGFLISLNGELQASGTIQWSRTVRDEMVLLEEANTGIDGVMSLLGVVAGQVASRASQASLDELKQTVLANESTILANQATILANQATITAKLDQILRKLR